MKTTKFIFAALILTCGSMAHAAFPEYRNWIGAGGATTTIGAVVYGNFTDPANWQENSAPNNFVHLAVIGTVAGNGGRVLMDGGDMFVSSIDPAPQFSTVGGLEINGGIFQIRQDGSLNPKTIRIGDGANANGVITQTGGLFSMNTGELRIGNNNTTGGHGLYAISGGTLSTATGPYPGGKIFLNRNKIESQNTSSYGELRISGTATVDLGRTVGNANGNLTSFALNWGPGNATVSVEGPSAAINVDSLLMRNVGTVDLGVLRFTFDDLGVSTIHVNGTYTAAQSATAGATAILSQGRLLLDYTGCAFPTGTTIDLMTADKIIVDPSFVLDPSNVGIWSLSVVGTGVMGDGQLDVLRATLLSGSFPGTSIFVPAGTTQTTSGGAFNCLVIQDGGTLILGGSPSPAPEVTVPVPVPAAANPLAAITTGSASTTNSSVSSVAVAAPSLDSGTPPPAEIHGTYRGLFDSGSTSKPGPGLVTFTLNRLNRFSGTVRYEGQRYALTGALDSQGRFAGMGRFAGRAPLRVTMNLVVQDGKARMTGAISAPKKATAFQADRAVLTTRANAASPISNYHLKLVPEVAGKSGHGLLQITPNGIARFAGRLASGAPFSAGSQLSQTGLLPLFISPGQISAGETAILLRPSAVSAK